MRKKLLICLIISSISVVPVSWAQKNQLLKDSANEKVPVEIKGQRAELENNPRKIIYTGDVIAVRGDVTMYSDKLEGFFDKEGKELDRIVATGQVKIVQGTKIITAKNAVYYEKEQKVILTGEPVCRDEENVLKGSEITYYFNQERIIVEDAETVLHPDKIKQQQDADSGRSE